MTVTYNDKSVVLGTILTPTMAATPPQVYLISDFKIIKTYLSQLPITLVTYPLTANQQPALLSKHLSQVSWTAKADALYTLALLSPDDHPSDPKSELLHWCVVNIPGCEVEKGNHPFSI